MTLETYAAGMVAWFVLGSLLLAAFGFADIRPQHFMRVFCVLGLVWPLPVGLFVCAVGAAVLGIVVLAVLFVGYVATDLLARFAQWIGDF